MKLSFPMVVPPPAEEGVERELPPQDDGGDLYEKSLWIKSVIVHVFDLELRGTGSTEGIKESNHL